MIYTKVSFVEMQAIWTRSSRTLEIGFDPSVPRNSCRRKQLSSSLDSEFPCRRPTASKFKIESHLQMGSFVPYRTASEHVTGTTSPPATPVKKSIRIEKVKKRCKTAACGSFYPKHLVRTRGEGERRVVKKRQDSKQYGRERKKFTTALCERVNTHVHVNEVGLFMIALSPESTRDLTQYNNSSIFKANDGYTSTFRSPTYFL